MPIYIGEKYIIKIFGHDEGRFWEGVEGPVVISRRDMTIRITVHEATLGERTR